MRAGVLLFSLDFETRDRENDEKTFCKKYLLYLDGKRLK